MGSGFRVWTAGEVVSASNVNNYLQEQAVMSFAGTAARSSAIASPEEGMLSYLQDSDTYQGYDGSAWVNLGTLSGASDSGLVHIVTATFTTTSAESINDIFSATYSNYKIILKASLASGGELLKARLRVGGADASGSNYDYQFLNASATSVTGGRSTNQTSWELGSIGSGLRIQTYNIDIYNPFETDYTGFYTNDQLGDSNARILNISGTHGLQTSYTGLTIFPSGSTISGTYSVFGYAKA